MKISERLLAWQVLLSLSEGKGFSLAADKFGRDEAFYCRLTHGLETEIGIRLTEPHSRPVRLTQEAIELLPEIECYLEAAKTLKEKILSFIEESQIISREPLSTRGSLIL